MSTTMSEAGIATKHGLIDWNILQQVTKELEGGAKAMT